MKIILRSASPRRKELLEKAGYDFDIDVADIDETMDSMLTAEENVKRLGLMKASHNKEKFYGDILIGCDTIVVYDGVIYGKPIDEVDAFNTLKLLSNKTHQVMSGVGIIYKDKEYNFVSISDVTFKDLSDNDIYEYIKTKECFGKAGSYAIQGIGGKLVDHYKGSLENIIGLPIKEVIEILGEIYGMEN